MLKEVLLYLIRQMNSTSKSFFNKTHKLEMMIQRSDLITHYYITGLALIFEFN